MTGESEVTTIAEAGVVEGSVEAVVREFGEMAAMAVRGEEERGEREEIAKREALGRAAAWA